MDSFSRWIPFEHERKHANFSSKKNANDTKIIGEQEITYILRICNDSGEMKAIIESELREEVDLHNDALSLSKCSGETGILHSTVGISTVTLGF